MMEIYEFDPVIYPYRVWVTLGDDPDSISDFFNEYSGKSIIFNEGDVDKLAAFTMPVIKKKDQNCGVILFFRSRQSMTYELVAHEASHAAKYLFNHIGANVAEHEPFEFVVGWIAGCCEKVKSDEK